jgi:tRNA uridine 5-carboxymethylaminomethyl modification enzyme
VPLTKLVCRPEIGWPELLSRLPQLAAVDDEVARQVMFDLKYAGYVARQDAEVARHQRLAQKRIPADVDYFQLPHLRMEAREKLARIRPLSLDQAGRISGITPADIALLVAYLTSVRGCGQGDNAQVG